MALAVATNSCLLTCRASKESSLQTTNFRNRIPSLFPSFWPWEKVKIGPLPVSPLGGMRSSLERLQIQRIGIGQLHWSTANYAPFQELSLWDGLVAMYEKVQFSLLSMGDSQMELKDICNSLGIRIISYSPLGLGMLIGKYTASKLPAGPRQCMVLLFRQILPGLKPLLNALEVIAQKRGKTIPQAAINWCICKGTVPIPGMKSVRQAEDNLGALGWRLSSDEIFQLEAEARESPRDMIQNVFQTR